MWDLRSNFRMREDYNTVIVTPAKRVPPYGILKFFLFLLVTQGVGFLTQSEPPSCGWLSGSGFGFQVAGGNTEAIRQGKWVSVVEMALRCKYNKIPINIDKYLINFIGLSYGELSLLGRSLCRILSLARRHRMKVIHNPFKTPPKTLLFCTLGLRIIVHKGQRV